jgi:DNA-binding XRE family transcriptional regulator
MKSPAETAGRTTQRFSEIRRPVTPDRRARIDAVKRAIDEAQRLGDLRASRGVTQTAIADRLGVKQPTVSELEHRQDVSISTLRDYVEALGGELCVQAVFPGEEPVMLLVDRPG